MTTPVTAFSAAAGPLASPLDVNILGTAGTTTTFTVCWPVEFFTVNCCTPATPSNEKMKLIWVGDTYSTGTAVPFTSTCTSNCVGYGWGYCITMLARLDP